MIRSFLRTMNPMCKSFLLCLLACFCLSAPLAAQYVEPSFYSVNFSEFIITEPEIVGANSKTEVSASLEFDGTEIASGQTQDLGQLMNAETSFYIDVKTAAKDIVYGREIVLNVEIWQSGDSKLNYWYVADGNDWKLLNDDGQVELRHLLSDGKENKPNRSDTLHRFSGKIKPDGNPFTMMIATAYIVNSSQTQVKTECTSRYNPRKSKAPRPMIRNVASSPFAGEPKKPKEIHPGCIPLYLENDSYCSRIEFDPGSAVEMPDNVLVLHQDKTFISGPPSQEAGGGTTAFFLPTNVLKYGWNQVLLLRKFGDYNLKF